MSERRPLALVTGASSGIGRELARLLAADGHDVVLIARHADALEAVARELAGGPHTVIACDLSDPTGPARLLNDLAGRGLEVDVLINNAGFGVFGPFAVSDPASIAAMIRLNVASVTELARGVLPGMLARRSGRILNLASTAAFQPGPLMAVYYATKAYVLSFSEALANEVAGSGVTVTALCPGPTRTDFLRRAGVGGTRLFRGPLVSDAASVARAGYAGLRRGRRVVVPGLANRIFVQALRLTPRRVATAVARRVQEARR
jgi:short-subunit dehydrogenase